MLRRIVRSSALAVVLASCAGTSDPATVADGALSVSVAKSSYTWSEIDAAGGIRGTVANQSDRSYYARLGDAFNGAEEQALLFIANGSDGTLERAEGASWHPVGGAQLIEGVKIITLRPGSSYAFVAQPSGARQTGMYRVAIEYRVSATATETTRIVSASFEIR